MPARIEIQSKPLLDKEDQYVSAAVPINSGDGLTTAPFKLISFRTRIGCRGFIRALGNVAAPGGETSLTFRLLFNGARVFPYDGSQVQWGDPALLQDLPQRIEVPQGTTVQVQVDNSSGTDAYVATARVWVDYEDF